MLLYSYTGWDGWLVLLGADAISGDAWPMLLSLCDTVAGRPGNLRMPCPH